MRSLALVLFILALVSKIADGQKLLPAHDISISKLKFLSEYDVPNASQFKGTTIGGLSGIDRDAHNDLYYLISDDRSAINPARMYSARIHIRNRKIDSVEFVNVKSLLQKDDSPYPNSRQDPYHTPDPEGIRYNPLNGQVIWSSEGERIVRSNNIVLEDPSVIAIDKNGKYKDSFALPANMRMHSTENGPRQNGVFEGLTFSRDHKYLFVNVEEPIYEDGPRAGLDDSTGWIRILKFNAGTRKPIAQYAYQIEAVAYPPNPPGSFKINGVPDILCIGQNKFIVLERSFSTGRAACTIRVFLANTAKAANIAGIDSLRVHPGFIPISKKLLLNMDSLGRYIDNIEGVCFGPILANGHRTLVFVADNNFSPLERSQFLLFEIIP